PPPPTATEPRPSVAPPRPPTPPASSPPRPQAGAGLSAGRRRARRVDWPQARDRVAKPEGARLAAAEELISRERNVDFTRRNQHSSPAKSGGCSYPGVAQHLAPQNPRGHHAVQPHSTLRGGNPPCNRTAPSARVSVCTDTSSAHLRRVQEWQRACSHAAVVRMGEDSDDRLREDRAAD